MQIDKIKDISRDIFYNNTQIQDNKAHYFNFSKWHIITYYQ